MLADMIVKYKRFDFNQCFLFKKEVNGVKVFSIFQNDSAALIISTLRLNVLQ